MIHYAEMMKRAWDHRMQDRRAAEAELFDTSERREDPEPQRAWWHAVRGCQRRPYPQELT